MDNRYKNENYRDIFNDEDIERIISMYNSDFSIDDIMSEFNMSEHYIRLVLKDNQIDRKYNTLNEEIYKRAISKYISGMTLNEISYDLLITEHCVSKTLNKRGIKKRSCSENNRKYNRNSHYFDKIDSQNKAYILGLIFADGNNQPEHSAITIHLQEEDKDLLDRVRQEIEYEGPLRFNPLHSKNPNHKNQYILTINDAYMSRKLESLGVVKAKSLILKFPDYLRIKYIRHFIRGYFDGDGCISFCESTQKTSVLICGTYEMCSKISDIIHSLNGKCSITHPKQCEENNTYVLCISGYNSVNNFMEWIYEDADIKMDRKYQKYLQIKNRFKTNINSLIA